MLIAAGGQLSKARFAHVNILNAANIIVPDSYLVPAANWLRFPFGTIIQDTDGIIDTISNPNRFLIPAWANNIRFCCKILPQAQLNATGLANVNAGAFNIGTIYKIISIGTTDFTLIGAVSNTVGLAFTATGVGAGTGTANASSLPGHFGLHLFRNDAPTNESFFHLYTQFTIVGVNGVIPDESMLVSPWIQKQTANEFWTFAFDQTTVQNVTINTNGLAPSKEHWVSIEFAR